LNNPLSFLPHLPPLSQSLSQSIGKGSLWSIDPEYRHNLIQALKKTPYHPYSPGLVTPSTSPPTSPQAYHSPLLWPRSPFFRKNGVLLHGRIPFSIALSFLCVCIPLSLS
uniref:Fork-head domain-containing protein n=1 Tax=Hucho hucho TaxID=62062 RepID=A0A4W5KNU5_9TELE